MPLNLTEATNAEFATVLRKLADIYEANPTIPKLHTLSEGSELVFCWKPKELADVLHAFAGFGKFSKTADDSSVKFAAEGLPFSIHLFHGQVCERVAVGEKVIAAEPERIIPAKPERVETIYEWKCPDSFLKVARKKIETPVPEIEACEEVPF